MCGVRLSVCDWRVPAVDFEHTPRKMIAQDNMPTIESTNVVTSPEEISERLHGDHPQDTVVVSLDGALVKNLSAGAATLRGSARGTTFVDCDFRGACLVELLGARFIRCMIFEATLPADAVIDNCYRNSLFYEHVTSH